MTFNFFSLAFITCFGRRISPSTFRSQSRGAQSKLLKMPHEESELDYLSPFLGHRLALSIGSVGIITYCVRWNNGAVWRIPYRFDGMEMITWWPANIFFCEDTSNERRRRLLINSILRILLSRRREMTNYLCGHSTRSSAIRGRLCIINIIFTQSTQKWRQLPIFYLYHQIKWLISVYLLSVKDGIIDKKKWKYSRTRNKMNH